MLQTRVPGPSCPRCGHDFDAAGRITRGRFTLAPLSGFSIDDKPLELEPRHLGILRMLMDADGETVTADTLCAHSLEPSRKALQVHVCRIRDRFEQLGINCPIETVHGKGYRWNVEAPQLVTRKPLP